MWVICEICELEDVDETLFNRFSVSKTPHKWVHVKNGILHCYWPKYNAAAKIKSCEDALPDNKNWKAYKCRILMNGVIFKTYEEASEAENISQNYSTLTEYNAGSDEKENVQNSYKNEIVNNVNPGVEDISTNTDEISPVSSFSDTDNDMVDEVLIGNDSFEYNERMKYGGDYLSKADHLQYETKEVDAKREGSYQDDNHSSQESDYSLKFNANASGFLTSTLTDESNEARTLASKQVAIANSSQEIDSQISEIEIMCSSFATNVEQELKKLKELISVRPDPMVPVQRKNEILKSHKGNEKNGNVGMSKIEIVDVQYLGNELAFGPFVPSVIDLYGNDAIAYDLNAENVEVPNGVDLNAHVPMVNYNENVPPENVPPQNVPTENVPPENVPPGNVPPVTNDVDPVDELPISNFTKYDKVKDLLEEENEKTEASGEEYVEKPIEEALVEYLSPYEGESEDKYVDRTITRLFTQQFFIDSISWKKEEGRVLIKDSLLLKCWKKSHEKTFQKDEDNSRFKHHFRRFKSAKRAAMKAKGGASKKIKRN